MENRRLALVAKCLWEFQENTLDVHGLMLVGTDGFVMASTVTPSPATSRIAAVAVALLGLAKQASAEMGRGGLHEVRVGYDESRFCVLTPVSDTAVLVVATESLVNNGTGLIALEVNRQRCAAALTQLMTRGTLPPVLWLPG
jgi:predicted regulator of Ras-like GTPase activity (Roadblock/LC7/MglB family)